MAKKILNIIDTPYRATLEEQDDTIVWLSHAMRGGGGNVDVLLRGSAVNYLTRGQDASGLAFGDWRQTHPPDVAGDLASLAGEGASVYYVQDDAAERGIEEVLPGFDAVSRQGLAKLLSGYDLVFTW